MNDDLILVTGGTGFLASHCILQALQAGYRVRTTVRSAARESDIRKMMTAGGIEPGGNLSVVCADLMADTGWAEAVAGCRYVLHVASPFPVKSPKNADDVIRPAREGTLRVLAAARDAGVRRVVLTSSFAAVGYSPKPGPGRYTETDFTDPDDANLSAYVKSKALAERAAWDFIAREGSPLELAVINPVGIFGPILGPDLSGSVGLIKALMTGALPFMPRISFGVVDVRDVADLHLLAMTHAAANGQRFIAVDEGPMSLPQIAALLRTRMGTLAAPVPHRVMPDWMVRFAATFIPAFKDMVPLLAEPKDASNEKARRLLGWTPRAREDAIIGTAESLVRFDLLDTRKR